MEKAISIEAKAGGESEVSRARLIVLRALYALIVVGLALFVWPSFVAQLPEPAHYHGVVMTMLAAFSILCALGVRYPLQMLPLLLWELVWKSMWLLLIALPRWQAGTMDEATTKTAIDCAVVVLVLAAVPWGYVARQYLRKPAERASPRTAPAGTPA